jgi:PiT family inorganic phosphate transporter
LKAHALRLEQVLRSGAERAAQPTVLTAFADESRLLANQLDTLDRTKKSSVVAARKEIQTLNKGLKGALEGQVIQGRELRSKVLVEMRALSEASDFAPTWIVVLISVCLGLGTMIGWKRIVVTIGEKIGKSHLTYAQGASAELCAAATIGVSTGMGLPVSTTHVLSSGVAGTMVAQGGVQNLRRNTIMNIALAWLLTLPVSFVVAAVLYYLLHFTL